MAGMQMGPPFWYVCNYCNTAYHQTRKPRVCRVCGRKDFRVVTSKSRTGVGYGKPIVLDPHA